MRADSYNDYYQNEDDIKRIIGNRIRRIREEQGYSMTDVADAAGISQGALSNYERGIRDIPSTVIDSISQFLNVSVDYLFGYKEDPQQSIDNTLINELRENGFRDDGVSGLMQSDFSVRFISFLVSHKQYERLLHLLDRKSRVYDLYGISYRSFLVSQCLYVIVNDFLQNTFYSEYHEELRELSVEDLESIDREIAYVFGKEKAYDDHLPEVLFDEEMAEKYPEVIANDELQRIKRMIGQMRKAKGNTKK